jgi:hypothetical protein
MLIPTVPAAVSSSSNSLLAPPRVITRKTSFSAALRNLALNHHWRPHTEEAVADHVAVTSLNLLRPSAEFYGKEEEEGLYSPLTPFLPYGLSTDLECPKMIIPLNIPSSTRDPPFDLLTLTSPTAASVSIHFVYLEPSNHTLVLSPGK